LEDAENDAGAVRRALRQACRQANQTVDDAEQSTDALREAFGPKQGHGPGTQESLRDLEEVRALHALLQHNKTLAYIAQLSGRLARLGQAHKKTQVDHAVGSMKGITLGGNLDRVLPSELVGLRSGSKLLRLQTLEKLLGKRALQYLWRGEESETRGPMIVLCDESGSMAHTGKQEWSKAVALALLTIAAQQQRAAYLLGFNYVVTHEHHFPAGHTDTPGLCAALMARCTGGTEVEAPMRRALAILHDVPTMRKADIVLISDGEASVSPEFVAEVLQVRRTAGVQLYLVLIGGGANSESLRPIATATYQVSGTPDRETGKVAPLLAQVS
jgi:uncharacterized protein with von Willebrand factor type A (vWA) domain